MNPELLAEVISNLLDSFATEFLGPKRSIYCYRTKSGDVPARDFLNGLKPEAAASYARSFAMVSQGHENKLRGDKWHSIQGHEKLYEFKHNSSQTRLIHTTDSGGLFILLVGFGGKKEKKIKQGHITRAQKMRDEYLARRKVIEKSVNGRR